MLQQNLAPDTSSRRALKHSISLNKPVHRPGKSISLTPGKLLRGILHRAPSLDSVMLPVKIGRAVYILRAP